MPTFRWRALPAAPRALLFVLVSALLLALPLASSRAASPDAGTVSDANRSVTWTGPAAIATASGCTGGNDATCDKYKLTIQPPSYGFTVQIRLQPVGDWDLYVYGPNGGLAGSSGNGPNQLEIVTLTNPAAGTYTVAAAPFAPLLGPDGNSYTASATLAPLDTTVPGANGSENVSYANYPAPN